MGTVVYPPKSGSTEDFRPAPAGNHPATCVGVIDIGHHYETWEGKSSWKAKAVLLWEIDCDEQREDGQPFVLSRTFNLSLHENSTLRKFLEPWIGKFTDAALKGFDLKGLLDRPCMLTVEHSEPNKEGKVWADVTAATPLPKRMVAPEPKTPLRYYSTDDGPPPADLPKHILKRIGESQEFASGIPAAIPAPPKSGQFDEGDGGVPF